MGTPYTFDKGMSCNSTSIELLYFADNFCRIALWVLALSHTLLFRPCCAALSMLCSFQILIVLLYCVLLMVLNLSGFFVLPLLAIPSFFRTHFVILTMRDFLGGKVGWGPCWVVLAMSSCFSHAMVFGHSNLVMDYDEACFMHLTPGVVHNFPKAVGV